MPSDVVPELDSSNLDVLQEFAKRSPFSRGRLICVQGQPADGLHVIGEGSVLLCRATHHDDDDYALHLLTRGQLFGEGALHPAGRCLASARALTNGFCYVIPTGLLPSLFQHYPAAGRHLLTLLSLRLESAHRSLDTTQITDARDRVLTLLRDLGDLHGRREGHDVWISLPLTQSELAQMAGLARETVTRTLSGLTAEGRIRREPRRGICLFDAPEPDSPEEAPCPW